MIVALDADYPQSGGATVAIVGFEKWEDCQASYQNLYSLESVEPYEAGKFYKRELPCLLEALRDLKEIDLIIVDGYVWLGEPEHWGLGMYLFDALEQKIPVVGVAKNRFRDTPKECEIFRGKSKKPLYVTAVGIELEEAKALVSKMCGEYRVPTLLKEVDRVCREGLSS